MQEMRVFIQQVLSDQAEDITKLQYDLEEARTWATSARWTAQHMKTEVKHLGHETQEVKAEIKEVLEVHLALQCTG